MSFVRSFKSYVNLAGTERKIKALLANFEITSFEAFIKHDLGLTLDAALPENTHCRAGVATA
jgi:hypothetical protein